MTQKSSLSPTQKDVSQMSDLTTMTQALIGCQSVTPKDEGALDLLEGWLQDLQFSTTRLPFQEEGTAGVDNLFAIFKHPDSSKPHLCFAGHVDVVPPGPLEKWQSNPFKAEIRDDTLIGRGAVDMKGAITAFIAALKEIYQEQGSFPYTISLLITGDEEDVAINGTKKVLKWLEAQKIKPDFCLVGEPTSVQKLGDTIKVGRRGSLNTHLTLEGKQGHVAFPQFSDNPIPKMVKILTTLLKGPSETPSTLFEPTNLEVTSIDVGNSTTNLIPQDISARFNIRFNDQHTGKSLAKWIEGTIKEITTAYKISFEFSGDADLCQDETWTQALERAITLVTAQKTQRSTAGATSDARFIKDICPVVEFGLLNTTMHQIDERVSLKDLEDLKRIYHKFILEAAIR